MEDQVFEIALRKQKEGRSFTIGDLRRKLGTKFYGPEFYVLRINGREYELPNSKGKREDGLTFVTMNELVEHVEYCFELDKSFYE